MQKIVKVMLFTIGLLFLSGCATHQNFVQKNDRWVGKNINTLITTLGYPDTILSLPDKHKVYVYEHSRVYSIPSGPIMGYGGYYGYYGMFGYTHEVISETCKVFFETDRKGTIIKWRARGNHCVSD